MAAARTDHRVVLAIPCFNEASRLRHEQIAELVADPEVSLVLVDDGSTDSTFSVLTSLAETHPQVHVLRLETNVGKAEAVRQGLLFAMTSSPDVVGFVDADFATPAGEVLRLVSAIRSPDGPAIVIGSRVLLSGRTVRRSTRRHILGRAVATYLSLAYELEIYDTQCGAKVFRCDDRLRAALAQPFVTRWLFDVELLLRVREGAEPASVREEPLEVWTDVPGSRLGPRQAAQVLRDFASLHASVRRRRR